MFLIRVKSLKRFFRQLLVALDQLADAVSQLKPKRYQARFIFMPRVFKADYQDFDLPVAITVTDSEGNPIPGAALPAGFTLTAESDNPEAFAILQDDANPLLFHCHVGSPGDATLTATLTDASGATVAIDAEAIVVTVGDPAAVSGIDFQFPPDVPNN